LTLICRRRRRGRRRSRSRRRRRRRGRRGGRRMTLPKLWSVSHRARRRHARHNFSRVLSVVTLGSKYATTLTYENFFYAHHRRGHEGLCGPRVAVEEEEEEEEEAVTVKQAPMMMRRRTHHTPTPPLHTHTQGVRALIPRGEGEGVGGGKEERAGGGEKVGRGGTAKMSERARLERGVGGWEGEANRREGGRARCRR
jgi:hypothetical protein